MKLEISKDANVNYLAKIIKIDDFNFSKHPNADKLKLVHIFGTIIATDINAKSGYYIYFPVECVINPDFLKFHNLYRDNELNSDKEKSGFFENKGRVRCIKLRGVISDGFIMPIKSLTDFIGESKISDDEFSLYENQSFDTINGKLLTWKYVVEVKGASLGGGKKKEAKIVNSIVNGQFRYHIDTPKLLDNVEAIQPNDLIQISWKEHGTSAILCNLLTKKKIPVITAVGKLFGKEIVKKEYVKFCSSRKVIKDPVLNPKIRNDFYDFDIWNAALQVLDTYLTKGMSIYCEIAGYMPDGKMIQKDYDYNCIYEPKIHNYNEMSALEMYNSKLFDIIIYRITITNVDGDVYEFSARQIQEWCLKNGLNAVKELFYGYAKDLFKIDTENNWNENFIELLRERYLEKDSILCKNKVPEEGIVLRREVNNINVYKLKSLRFLQKESEQLDMGEADIESKQN